MSEVVPGSSVSQSSGKTIVHSGWLYKRGEQSWASWKKRYFRLWSTKIFEYFVDEKLEDKKGTIDLSPYSQGCVMVSNKCFKSKKESAEYGFCIITKNRTYELCTTKNNIRKEWMSKLQFVISLETQFETTYVEMWRKFPYNLHTETFKRKWEIESTYILNYYYRLYNLPIKSLNDINRLIILYVKSMTYNEFGFISVLGSGYTSQVILVRDLIHNGTLYSMKIINKSKFCKPTDIINLQRERQIWSQLDHPFIVTMHYAFQDSKYLYYIMDYYSGGELFYHLKEKKKFTELETKYIILQIILGIGYLHSLNIIYRSCKPEDIVMDNLGYVGLTDFGCSRQLSNSKQRSTSIVGTLEYRSPEIILGMEYNMSSDWWSVGTLLYELLHGIPPFYHNNHSIMNNCILNDNLEILGDFSNECKDLITKLLCREPTKRLGYINDYKDIISHSWFKSIDINKLKNKQIKLAYKPKELHNSIDISNFDKEFTKLDCIVSKEKKIFEPGSISMENEYSNYFQDIWNQPEMAWDYPM